MKGHGLCPLYHQGFDEPLGYNVGSWGVRLGEFGCQAKRGKGFSTGFRAVGAGVIGENTSPHDPLGIEPGQGPQKKTHGSPASHPKVSRRKPVVRRR